MVSNAFVFLLVLIHCVSGCLLKCAFDFVVQKPKYILEFLLRLCPKTLLLLCCSRSEGCKKRKFNIAKRENLIFDVKVNGAKREIVIPLMYLDLSAFFFFSLCALHRFRHQSSLCTILMPKIKTINMGL